MLAAINNIEFRQKYRRSFHPDYSTLRSFFQVICQQLLTNAEKYVSFLKYPKDPKFAESIRHFQGAPSIAITKGGRIFMGWHTGGICEPHIDNYNVLIKFVDINNSMVDTIAAPITSEAKWAPK